MSQSLFFYLLLFLMGLTSCNMGGGRKDFFHGVKVNSDDFESVTGLKHDEGSLSMIDMSGVFDSPSNFDFTGAVNDFHVIVLETRSDVLIGEVNKVTIQDSLIYVLDIHNSNSLNVFRYDGSFVRAIGKPGKGPGEYNQVTDFYVDSPAGVVTLYDQFKASLMDYSLEDGSYQRTRKIVFRCAHFTKLGARYLFEANSRPNDHISAIEDKALIVASDDMNILSAAIDRVDLNFGGNVLTKIDDHLALMSIPFVDTIYYTDGETVWPRYGFVFDSRLSLPDDFLKRSRGDFERFRDLYPRDQYVNYTGNFVENGTHLYWSVGYNRGQYLFFRDKNSGALFWYNPYDITTKGAAPDASLLWGLEPVSALGDQFIAVKDPQLLTGVIHRGLNPPVDAESEDARAEQRLLERFPKLKTLTADDNPVLILFKL